MHGIPQHLINDAFGVSQNFFSQSQQVKEAASPFSAKSNAGYEYMTQARPSTMTHDQKENLQITARRECVDGLWPSTSHFRTVTEALLGASHRLACRILDLLKPKACPHLELGTLSKSHNLWDSNNGQCTLRLLHYLLLDADTAKKLTTPLDDSGPGVHWGAGARPDWGNIPPISTLGTTRFGMLCQSPPNILQHQHQGTHVVDARRSSGGWHCCQYW